MSGDLIRTERQDIESYEPERHRLKVRAIDYSIEEAKRIKDRPALENAVDAKIDEQQKFVAWWNGNVRSVGNPQLAGTAANCLTRKDAEHLTGMKHQRVSDLSVRNVLK